MEKMCQVCKDLTKVCKGLSPTGDVEALSGWLEGMYSLLNFIRRDTERSTHNEICHRVWLHRSDHFTLLIHLTPIYVLLSQTAVAGFYVTAHT